MSDQKLPESRVQAEHLSFTRDVNNKLARRVTDEVVSEKLDTIINQREGTLTDRSGIATTSSAQIAPANANRKYFFIQNNSTGTIWFNFGISAVTNQPSIKLEPNETKVFEGFFISTESIHIIAATSTRTFTAKEG